MRIAAGVLAVVIVVNVVLYVLDSALGGQKGPTSSSYATAPDGLAAYAALLSRRDREVQRLRESPAEAPLDPATTLVILDPDAVDSTEAKALRRFVERGGTLLAGGAGSSRWLEQIDSRAPAWGPSGSRTARPQAPAPEVRGVGRVKTAGAGSFEQAGAAMPLLAGNRGDLLVVRSLGAGRLLMLADASPLQNRLLPRADNAALGVALTETKRGPIVFAEHGHGYGAARGLAALPTEWKAALAGLLLAGLIWMLARGRRLGPPEDPVRRLPPPRRAYVDALAASLARTKEPAEAGEPLLAAARGRLARRAALPPHAGAATLEKAAARLGLEPDEARVLRDGVASEEDLLAAGRALSRLEGGAR